MAGKGIALVGLAALGVVLLVSNQSKASEKTAPKPSPQPPRPGPAPGPGGGPVIEPPPGPVVPGGPFPAPGTPVPETADDFPVDPGPQAIARMTAGEPAVASVEPTTPGIAYPTAPKPGIGKPVEFFTYTRADLAGAAAQGRKPVTFGSHAYVRFWTSGGDMPPNVTTGIPGITS